MSTPDLTRPHRVYWGSHGCMFNFGHDGDCLCDCCDCVDHKGSEGRRYDWDDGGAAGEFWVCVGAPPYYGPETAFYGEDVPAALTST